MGVVNAGTPVVVVAPPDETNDESKNEEEGTEEEGEREGEGDWEWVGKGENVGRGKEKTCEETEVDGAVSTSDPGTLASCTPWRMARKTLT